MYCVSQLRAFPSYGHCPDLHCPDKGGLTVHVHFPRNTDWPHPLNGVSYPGYIVYSIYAHTSLVPRLHPPLREVAGHETMQHACSILLTLLFAI